MLFCSQVAVEFICSNVRSNKKASGTGKTEKKRIEALASEREERVGKPAAKLATKTGQPAIRNKT